MAKSTALNFTQKIAAAASTFVNADAALTTKTLYTGGTNDAVVKSINVSSDDTSARVVDLLISISGTDYLIGSVSVAANSGSNGTLPSISLLSGAIISGVPYDKEGNRVIPLPAGVALRVRNQTQVTSGKTVSIVAVIEEY